VALSDASHVLLERGRAPAAAIMATGKDPDFIGAALEGLAAAGRKSPDLIVFLDGQAGDRPAIWKRARRLKLLDRLTVVADMEEHREPVLRIDLLLQPEPLAEHHSMTLSAMASGTLVIATRDPLVESLNNAEIATLVGGPSSPAWEQAIGGVLDDPDRARSIAALAREYVREEHSLTGHVRAVCAAYESIRGEPGTK
jgi:glycosyltransferase involved in cell wall biosynthesis